MIECDDTNWPLAIVLAEEAMTLADHRHFLKSWSAWLDRASPFVLLRIFTTSQSTADPEGALTETWAWLKANAERVRAHVLAISTAVPRDQLDRAPEAHIGRLFGVPTRVFTDGPSAVSWLRAEILAPAGLSLDSL
jgi:hypothetical protein